MGISDQVTPLKTREVITALATPTTQIKKKPEIIQNLETGNIYEGSGQRQVLRAENLGIIPRFSPIVTQIAQMTPIYRFFSG